MFFPTENQQIDVGNNPLQVTSDDFDIYQEYIEGDGELGNQAFSDYGHMDFAAKQVIKNSKDGKLYLIDTKEQKNFFLPMFLSYEDIMLTPQFSGLYEGKEKDYKNWQEHAWKKMIEVKKKNLGSDIKSLQIKIECGIHCLSTDNMNGKPPEEYKLIDFSQSISPLQKLQYAIKDSNIEDLKKIFFNNTTWSLKNEKILSKAIQNVSLYLTPIQAAVYEIKDPKKRLEIVKLLVNKGAECGNPFENKEIS